MDTAAIKRFMAQIPLLRGVASETTPYHCGHVWENRLGYQVLRILTGQVQHKLKPRHIPAHLAHLAATLEHDGIVSIPNFLPRATFECVCAEAEQIARNMTFVPLRNAASGVMRHGQVADLDAIQAPHITTASQHRTLRALAGAVMGKTLGSPRIFLDHFKRPADETAVDNDIENLLHADLHLPTVKAWLLLEPVTMDNGPFYYAKTTHRINVRRLLHEYRKSILTAKLRAGSDKIPAHLLATRGAFKRIVLSPEEMEALRVDEVPMTGEANTLIVANTLGFHRRGEFQPGAIRRWLLFNYRHFNRGWS